MAEVCNLEIETNSHGCVDNSFFALPNRDHAKYILPYQSGFTSYWQGLMLYPAIYPKLLAKKYLAAASWPLAPILNRQHFSFKSKNKKNGNLAQHLYESLSTNSKNIDRVREFAARLGSAGKGFKLIFQFQDQHGKPISYIKVGDPETRGIYLANENRILQLLAKCRSLIEIPEVLGFKATHEITALEISPILSPHYFPRPPENQVAEVLVEFCLRTASQSYTQNSVQPENSARLNQFVEDVNVRNFISNSLNNLKFCTFPRPIVHRDLGGWNIFFTQNRKLAILDWEYAECQHLPLQDLLHYFLHTALNNTSLAPVDAYKKIFLKNVKVQKAIKFYADMVELNHPQLIQALIVAYLWDWFALERSRAEEGSNQGNEYLEILKWLAENENCN